MLCSSVIKIFNLSKQRSNFVNIVLLIKLFTSKSNATVRIKVYNVQQIYRKKIHMGILQSSHGTLDYNNKRCKQNVVPIFGALSEWRFRVANYSS